MLEKKGNGWIEEEETRRRIYTEEVFSEETREVMVYSRREIRVKRNTVN